MRLFIAALMPDYIQYKLANYIHSLRNNIDGVKWERSQKLHVTLKFLGDVKEPDLNEISNLVEKVVEPYSPFKMSISDFGSFPSLQNPRVLYVGLSKNKELSKFQNKLDDGLSQIGFEKEERKFVPHITIGRVKQRMSIKDVPRISKAAFDINQIGIIKSELKPEGSLYTPLKLFTLNN